MSTPVSTKAQPRPARLTHDDWAATPSRADGVAARATTIIGGPTGRFAIVGKRGWRPAAAVCSALSALLIAVGVVQKNHCITNGWATPGSLWRYCYSDLPVAVSVPAGSNPWSNSVTQNAPPGTAILTWLVRLIVPGGNQLRLQQGMFAWGAGLIALFIAMAVCYTAAASRRGPWVAAHVGMSPVLVTTALISFDAFAVMLVAAGLMLWRKGRYLAAGAVLAAAFLVRPDLGVVGLACLLVALVHRRMYAAGMLAIGIVAVCAVVGGIMLACGGDVLGSFKWWQQQPASYGSLWYIFNLSGVAFSTQTLTDLAVFGWILAIVLGLVLARSEKRVEPEAVAIVMLVIVLATSRAIPAQAALWMLPLIALCGIRWRDHLLWAAFEFAYFIVLWPFVARDSNLAKALPSGWYATFTGIRIIAWFIIARAGMRHSLEWADEKPREGVQSRSGAHASALRSDGGSAPQVSYPQN